MMAMVQSRTSGLLLIIYIVPPFLLFLGVGDGMWCNFFAQITLFIFIFIQNVYDFILTYWDSHTVFTLSILIFSNLLLAVIIYVFLVWRLCFYNKMN